jgi:nucleotide-binding universal stress UspA family protein
MSIRFVLVPVYGMPSDQAALDIAAVTAKRFGAHVAALHVRRNPNEAVPIVGEGLSGPMVEEIIKAAEKDGLVRAQAARKTYEAWRTRCGLTHVESANAHAGDTCSWRETVGRPEAVVPRAARFADLVVAARPTDELDVTQPVTLEATIFGSGRPIMLAPAKPAASFPAVIAIAWNGSTEASRAVAAALPYLAGAKSVMILVVPESDTMADDAKGLADYLLWQGVSASVKTFAPDFRQVGQALLGEATKAGAELLVLGAYTHSRLRQMIMGGVTRQVLAGAEIPVLLVH